MFYCGYESLEIVCNCSGQAPVIETESCFGKHMFSINQKHMFFNQNNGYKHADSNYIHEGKTPSFSICLSCISNTNNVRVIISSSKGSFNFGDFYRLEFRWH